jgi:hypothetical protein
MTRRILCLAALVALAITLPVSASTFVAMDQGELVSQSNAVVEGRIQNVQSFWNEEHTMIFTHSLVEVESTVAGKAARFITVRTPGGTVGDYTVHAEGFPAFGNGDRVLLFVRQDGGAYTVTGHRLGHYSIQTQSNGVEMAVPTLEQGVELLTLNGAPAPRPQAVRLDELKAQIRGLQVGPQVQVQ